MKEANGRRKSRDFSNPEPDIFKRLVNRGNAEEYIIIPYFEIKLKKKPRKLSFKIKNEVKFNRNKRGEGRCLKYHGYDM